MKYPSIERSARTSVTVEEHGKDYLFGIDVEPKPFYVNEFLAEHERRRGVVLSREDVSRIIDDLSTMLEEHRG